MKKLILIMLALIVTSCTTTNLTNTTDGLKNKIGGVFDDIKTYQKKAWSKKD